MTLDELNSLDGRAFVAALDGVFEHSPWVAERAWAARPFASIDALHTAMTEAVDRATDAEKRSLLRAHPELAETTFAVRMLTAASAGEQSAAGLGECTPVERDGLAALNRRYRERFGFPFILAVRGYDRAGILAELARRADGDPGAEFAECLAQVSRIARFRLGDRLEAPPMRSAAVNAATR